MRCILASPRLQPLHEGVQNWTRMGQAGWKWPIQTLLSGLSPRCLKKQLCHNADTFQTTKRTEIYWTDASK
jgi:hypothetical protein